MHKCIHCNEEVMGNAYVGPDYFLHHECSREYQYKLAGLIHKCPKCSCTGEMDDPSGKMEDKDVPLGRNESPVCGYNGCWGCHYCKSGLKRIRVPVKVTCNLCNGNKRLKKEPVPISEVVDWKIEDDV